MRIFALYNVSSRKLVMNTKYLMVASAVVMGLIGISCTFFPQEIIASISGSETTFPVLILQVLGALYLGFAMMNWMAKTVLIGGIYARPLAMGNLMHFAIAGIALLKAAMQYTALSYLWFICLIYVLFALLFTYVFVTSPVKK